MALSIYAKFYIGRENMSRSGAQLHICWRVALHACCVFIPARASPSLFLQRLMYVSAAHIRLLVALNFVVYIF